MTKPPFYVYTIGDKEGVFYVGKGTTANDRHLDHLREARNGLRGSPKERRIQGCDFNPEFQFWYFDNERDALEFETVKILEYPDGQLCNIIKGHSGMYHGYKQTEEHRRKISQNNVGMLGKKHTADALAKISAGAKRPCSEEQKLKLSAAQKGRKVDPAKIAQYRKTMWAKAPELWLRAREVYSYWSSAKGIGPGGISKALGLSSKHANNIYYVMIRGWKPHEDPDWVDWSGVQGEPTGGYPSLIINKRKNSARTVTRR